MKYTGIDIGGTKCAVIIGDGNGKILKKKRFDTTTKDETLARIFAEVNELSKTEETAAIGISCGGPLNSKDGVIMSPPNLPGWDNVHITKMLTDRFNIPAYLQNDANACALAEWKFGAGRGTKNMIFLTFGTGMGAGLILDGHLYSGTNDMAGEVGHMRMEHIGNVGYGKAGSFEGFCSGGGIAQTAKTRALELLQCGRAPLYCKSISELDKITARSVAEAANAGDETASGVWRECGDMLGRGLSVLIDILNPERIVIGSIYARSGALMRNSMEKAVKRESLTYPQKVCEIVPAELGESIGDVAAISVAASQICKGE